MILGFSGAAHGAENEHLVVLEHRVNESTQPGGSRVTSISLRFNADVGNALSADMLRVWKLGHGPFVPESAMAMSYDFLEREATWTFPGLPGRSAEDGNYVVGLFANGLKSSDGKKLDGNSDGIAGDPYGLEMFRYFGDGSGDRDVDFHDTFFFRKTYQKQTGDPLFDGQFDSNADGKVDSADEAVFEKNYLSVLAAQPGTFATLVNDTGTSPRDGYTSDGTIAGKLFQRALVQGFRAEIVDHPSAPIDLMPLLAGDQTFRFDVAQAIHTNGQSLDLADGNYVLRFSTLDAAGAAASTFEVAFVLDRTPPDTDLAASIIGSAVRFEFAAMDNFTAADKLTFECSLDGGPFSTCSSPQELLGLPDGPHTYRVRAIDLAGNVDATPAEYAWVIDTTPPAITLALSPETDSEPIGDLQTTFEKVKLIGQTEAGLIVRLQVGPKESAIGFTTMAEANGTFEFVDVPLAIGSNALRATTSDLAGNEGVVDLAVTRLQLEDCIFEAELADWSIREHGGSDQGKGKVRVENCELVLHEGDSFLVIAERTYQLSEGQTALAFDLAGIEMQSAPGQMQDAFEIAVGDPATGAPLTHVFRYAGGLWSKHEANLNISASSSTLWAPGTDFDTDDTRGVIDLSHLPIGSSFKVVLRLINNNSTTTSSVRISILELKDLSLPPAVLPTGPIENPAIQITDFANLADVSSSTRIDYGVTAYNEEHSSVVAYFSIVNVGSYAFRGPIIAEIGNISDPTVHVIGEDGVTPDGVPYIVLTESGLASGESSSVSRLSFVNPDKRQFTFQSTVRAAMNRPPAFTSEPVVEAFPGKMYSYASKASDPDSDLLTFSLITAPAGMTINPGTGAIQWVPSAGVLGTHDVRVRVEDGRGGFADQSYVATVTQPPPNRPPYFTSIPVTSAGVTGYIDDTSEVFDLRSWTQIDFDDPHGVLNQFPGNWVVDSTGTNVVQTVNCRPSILLGETEVQSHRIRGRFGVQNDPDDDYIGFVFAFADAQHFYLFDWRRVTFTGSPAGMRVRAVNTQRQVIRADLDDELGIPPSLPSGIETLFSNSIPWKFSVEYGFVLDFRPGYFTISIDDGTNVVASFSLSDATFAGGKFGFYNASQGNTKYSGFAQSRIPDATYSYDSDASDPDLDTLTYSLISAPAGLSIDSRNGRVQWAPRTEQIGYHDVTISVSDGQGGTATQSFRIQINGDPENHPPVIISEPPLETSEGVPYHYSVLALDPDEDRLTYSLINGPTGMVIGSSTGLIEWTPTSKPPNPTSVLASEYSVSVYASITNPVGLSFDTNAFLYVGSDQGESPGSDPASRIRRISPGGSIVENYSTDILVDPDAVIVDQSGKISGVPGSILVGGLHTGIGQESSIRSVSPDGSSRVLFGPTTAFMNPNEFEFDSTGRLLIVANTVFDGTRSAVFTSSGGFPTQLFQYTAGGTIGGLAVDSHDNIFVLAYDSGSSSSTNDDRIRIEMHFPNGVLKNADFGGGFNISRRNPITGFRHSTLISMDRSSTRNRDTLYVLNNGTLFAMNDKGDRSIVAIGFGGEESDMTVGADGSIYISQYSGANKILRLLPAPLVEVEVTDGRGGFDRQSFVLTPSPVGTGEIRGSVFNDLNNNGRRGSYLLVNSIGGNRVLSYDGDTGQFNGVFASGSGLRAPEGISYGPDCNLYVASTAADGTGSILRFDGSTGAFLDVFASGGGMQNPHGLGFGPDGDLYVGSRGDLNLQNGSVLRFDGQTGTFNGTLSGHDIVDRPLKITMGPDGNLYVGFQFRSSILRYDGRSGDFLNTFVPSGSGGLNGPHDIVFGPDGNLYVASVQSGQILRYDGRDGAFLGIFISAGSGGLANPTSLVFGDDGFVYVASYDSNSVLRYNAQTGAFVDVFISSGSGGLTNPDYFIRVPSEPGLADRIVYVDTNANGRRDATERFTTTDACGTYSFVGLVPGEYLLLAEVPMGWLQSAPTSPGRKVVLTNQQIVTEIDFGSRLLTPQDPENRAPIFQNTPPALVVAGEVYRHRSAVIDPDGDAISFGISPSPTVTGLSVDTQTGLIVGRISSIGSHEFTLIARDSRGASTLQPFTIEVRASNSIPVITSRPKGPALVGQQWTYQIGAQDADGDALKFNLRNGPAGMAIGASSHLVTWTPNTAQIGSHHVEIAVSDDVSETTQSFDLPVVAPVQNDPPLITSIPKTSIRLGTQYFYQVSASDPDNDSFSVSLVQSPTGMAINATGLISWMPTSAQFGPNPVQVRGQDARGAAVVQSFSINVVAQSANGLPSITSLPRSGATVGKVYAYDAVGTDPDNDLLVWSLEEAPSGTSVDAERGTLRWLPTTDQIGSQILKLRASDPYGAFAIQTFAVTVRSVNLAPMISSAPPTKAAVDVLYAYSFKANDPEGGPLTFAVNAPTLGSAIQIDSSTGFIQFTPTSGQVGSHAITLTATDEDNGSNTQTYTLVVSATAENLAPVITSSPNFFAAPGVLYSYQVTANDPDGDSLRFLVLASPTGMTIDATTGLVSWTPSAAQLGVHSATVGAVDTDGLGGSQTFTIRVGTPNNPPTITSSAVQTVSAGKLYRYDVIANDPDGDVLSFALTQAPSGMRIDALGRIEWQTSLANAGIHRIHAEVRDTRGESITQIFDLEVFADTTPPVIRMIGQDSTLPVGSIIDIAANATDNIGVVSLVLTINGIPVPLDANGRLQIIADPAGVYEFVAVARDAAGNVGQDSFTLTVFDVVNDPTAPVVAITSPTDGATITHRINVLGTVSDDNLLHYTLSVAQAAGGSFVELARGTQPVVNGTLAKFDPSALANDTYVLRLEAMDAGGNISTIEQTVNVAGDLKIGNFRLSFADLTIPVSGIPITVTRTYDSLQAGTAHDIGFGWRLEFRHADLRTSVPRTTEFEQELGIYNALKEGSRVYVTLPGGRREGFTFRPTLQSGFAGSFFGFRNPNFVPDPSVTSRLTVENVTLQLLADGSYIMAGTGLPYNPEDDLNFGGTYSLSTKDGIGYEIDARTGDVTAISDMNGNTLTLTDSGIISSAGPKVTFERDPKGRIAAVVDPMGNKVRYTYDAAGDLIGVTDRQTNKTTFIYSTSRPHFLEQIIDPLGRTGVRGEYDASGRLAKLTDAQGNPVEMIHDLDNNTEYVKDPLGNITRFVYDERGNVTEEENAAGGITRRTYDANNYMLSENDPLGNKTEFTYDADGNVLTRKDPLGNVTVNTYITVSPGGMLDRIRNPRPIKLLATTVDPMGNSTENQYSGTDLISTRDAQGNTTTYAYDGAGNHTSITDALGGITRFEYDGAGNLVRQTDALGHVTSFTYDANGNQRTQTTMLTTETGVRTLTTTTIYDANGRPTSVQDAEGNITRTEYDELGKAVATIDALNHRTEMIYDTRGQLLEMKFADGTSSKLEYDAAGRRIASIDRADRRTQFEYDKVGRLITTIYADETPADTADNPRTRTEYDLAGRVRAQIDERQNRTTFDYDDAGRQILVRNALGAETRTRYDAAGRKIAQIDALGRETLFLYEDGCCRQTTVRFVDGTAKTTDYDALGRVVKETDQAGIFTRFEYDKLGRLITVIDALTNHTEYTYNEGGNLITQKDAEGRITRYDYDGLGRRITHILPRLQRASTVYNPVGNVARTVNFNQQPIQFEYDLNNRLATKRLPDGNAVQFTYTPTGRRQTIQDARGLTTYEYDSRDRLLRRTDPDGRGIAYAYDASGNRTLLATTTLINGQVTTNNITRYTFDALNRIETITDSDGGVTRYNYSVMNNMVRMELANGTVRTDTYDDLNRLQRIEHRNQEGPFANFDYTFDPSGHRSKVIETTKFNNQVSTINRLWEYDRLYRLTRETFEDPVNGNRTMTYVMDRVGNRLSRDDTSEGRTTYTYNANDELLTETLNGVTTTYTYDANGNTTSKINPSESTTYTWSPENRLTGAQIIAGGITKNLAYHYDQDGIRTVSIVDGVETRNLIDVNRAFAQVAEEYSPNGPVIAANTFGYHPPISRAHAGTRFYYHGDHLNTTRALTAIGAADMERYEFDGFGRILGHVGAGDNPYLFTGEQKDKNLQMDFLRERYLAVNLGRFYGRDPLMKNSSSSAQPFSYADSNPISNLDPSGLISIGELILDHPQLTTTLSIKLGGNRFSGFIGKMIIRMIMNDQQSASTTLALFQHYVGSTGNSLNLNDEFGDVPESWQTWIAAHTGGQVGTYNDASPYADASAPSDLVSGLGHFDIKVNLLQSSQRAYSISDTYTFGETLVTQQKQRHGFPLSVLSTGAQTFIKEYVKKMSGVKFRLEGGLEEEFEIATLPNNQGRRVEFVLIPQSFLVNVGKPYPVTGQFIR